MAKKLIKNKIKSKKSISSNNILVKKKRDKQNILGKKKGNINQKFIRSKQIKNYKNLLKKFKAKITNLVEKYNKSNRLIKKLKKNLKKKKKHSISLDKPKSKPDIKKIFNQEKYSQSYISKSIKLFDEYRLFIKQKFKIKNSNKEKNEIPYKNIHLYDMNNVKEFLINTKSYSNSTFINRYNLIRRTLIRMGNGSAKLLNDLKIMEYKNNSEKNSNIEELYSEFLIYLLNKKDINLIMFHILSFIIGFNTYEISNIKINNFINNFSVIKLKINRKNIQRKIDSPFKEIFELYTKKNGFNSTDFFLYPAIKNTTQISRTKYIEEKYKNFISYIHSYTKKNIDIFINDINKEKPRKGISLKLHYMFKFVEKIILNEDCELNDLLNININSDNLNENISPKICDNEIFNNILCSFCNDDSFEIENKIKSNLNFSLNNSIDDNFLKKDKFFDSNDNFENINGNSPLNNF